VDVPCNQVPRATAELVLRSPLLTGPVRAALLRSLVPFAEVRLVPLGPDRFAAAEADRLAVAYRPLLELCRLLAESLEPGEQSGPAACPAFLLDMERVFERYGTAHLLAAAERAAVSVQPLLRPARTEGGGPDLSMRPDVLLTRGGQPAAVVDFKWKRLSKSALITADVYQVLAYSAALGVGRAALVYPGRLDRVWRYRFADSPVRLAVHTLRVVGSRAACTESAKRLAGQLVGFSGQHR
jgi:5-methylcytosine-specific restriction enzyme subunit McrC